MMLPLHAAWLPASNNFCRADRCRDTIGVTNSPSDIHLFDCVLSVVDVEISSPRLRAALGWDKDLTFDVIRSQVRATLAKKPSNLPERMTTLIVYIANLFVKGKISDSEVDLLKQDIGDQPWIPVKLNELAPTRHVVFIAGIDNIGSFRKVSRRLSDVEDVIQLLRRMGCTDR